MSTIPIVCTRHDEPVVIDPVLQVKRQRHPRAAAEWVTVPHIDGINYHADGRLRLRCPVCRYDVQITGDLFMVFLILKHIEDLGETQAPLGVVEAMAASKKYRPTMRAWLNATKDYEGIAVTEGMKRLQASLKGDVGLTEDGVD